MRIDVEVDGTRRSLRGDLAGGDRSTALMNALAAALELEVDMQVLEHGVQVMGCAAGAAPPPSPFPAVAYVEVRRGRGRSFHGVGMDDNPGVASVKALMVAVNRSFASPELASLRSTS